MKVEARALFEDVRQSFQDDPLALYQIAVYYRDIGLYRSSILAARRITDLGDITPVAAPIFLARLQYPTYYSDLVISDAAKYDLDPLWVYSLMRQESLFEGFAVSTASAQGLMQIWPPTGADIASRIQWPGYQPSDLQRPFINVEFGTWLLREELNRFNDDRFAALAAYNAGPGNTATWVEQSQGDPDLFVESITLNEPQSYVQLIYQYYETYQAIYGSP
jgi:soluble lytic murein transglycosylase